MKQLLPRIGPETNGPSRLLNHPCPLSRSCKVVSGVCSMLGAARSADHRGGLCCGRHVARCTDSPVWCLGNPAHIVRGRCITTTEMLEDTDRENRALHMELFNARSDHWATLTRFAPAVQAGYMNTRDLYPVRASLPDFMEWREVGGITPPRGPRLSPSVGPRPHPSPYGPQAPHDRLFPDDHVPLPGLGGDFYEDFYGAV